MRRFVLSFSKLFFFTFIVLFFIGGPTLDFSSQNLSSNFQIKKVSANEAGYMAAADNPTTGNLANNEPQTQDSGGWMTRFISEAVAFTAKFFAVIVGLVSSLANMITSWFVSMSMFLLDKTIELSTDGFAEMMRGDGGVGEKIREAWVIFRDLGNIALIFALLYISISTIMKASSFASKKLLGQVIIAALLINFSYFFGTAVIDVSNIMAVSINNSLKEQLDGKTLGAYIHDATKSKDIFDRIKTDLGVPSSDDASKSSDTIQTGAQNDPGFFNNSVNWATGLAMAVILNMVIIVVFFLASFMLITRIIILMLLLVVAPIGIVGFALPKAEKMSSDWWRGLFAQSFFLPIFLLFVLVAVRIIGDEGSGLSGLDLDMTNGGEGNPIENLLKNIIGPLIQYSIVIGLFIAALIASKKLASEGGTAVNKLSTGITNTIGKGAFATAGFAGRSTVGWGAEKFKNSDTMQRFAKSNPRLGALTLKGLDGVAGSSFDPRGGRTFKGVATATGFGSDFKNYGGKKGYKGAVDAQGKFWKSGVDSINDLKETDDSVADEYRIRNDAKDILEQKKEAYKRLDLSTLPPAVKKQKQKELQELQKSLTSAEKDLERARKKPKEDAAEKLKNSWPAGMQKGGKDVLKELKKGRDEMGDLKKMISDLDKE